MSGCLYIFNSHKNSMTFIQVLPAFFLQLFFFTLCIPCLSVHLPLSIAPLCNLIPHLVMPFHSSTEASLQPHKLIQYCALNATHEKLIYHTSHWGWHPSHKETMSVPRGGEGDPRVPTNNHNICW